ncbi:MAG: C40 family peptidase [Zoogloeaceae bacterium]|nr:C40 family peptidase [Zoogloeaceae bacterium]
MIQAQQRQTRGRSLLCLGCAMLLVLWLSGCGTLGGGASHTARGKTTTSAATKKSGRIIPVRDLEPTPEGREVVMFALGLIGADYRFGGKNPEAGLDCSGMVSWIYTQATPLRISGSAADIARRGRGISSLELRPGDLVFFNTLNRPRSHVGIYIGEGRFVHAPSSNGQVRIDALNNHYFAQRFEEGRTYFDPVRGKSRP